MWPVCDTSEGVRRVEYGRWRIERGWGASNKVGGASKVAGPCRRWPGHAERGRELLEGWEYVRECVGLVEWGGALRAGAGVRRMGWGACLGCRWHVERGLGVLEGPGHVQRRPGRAVARFEGAGGIRKGVACQNTLEG